jgi:hypothetical protein
MPKSSNPDGKLGQQAVIISGFHHNRDIGMVFGGGADHRRTADIDVFDAVIIGLACPHRFFKRIEIDHQKIDGTDAMGQHRGLMDRIGTDGQQAAVDFRMQGFHPPIHHFRKAGDIRDIENRKAGIPDRLTGATGRYQFDPLLMQGPGEGDQIGLVRDGQQGTGDAAEFKRHGTVFLQTGGDMATRVRHSTT